MATAEKLPFSWRAVESLPDLERLRLVLDTLPDEEIVAALEAGRGRGRNDYPVRAMWCALIAGVVFQHASIQSLLRELGRNPALLEICGFDPLPFQSAPVTELREGSEGACAVTHPAQVRSTVPSHWNFSRFLGRVVRLEKERGLVSAMVESLRASLFEEGCRHQAQRQGPYHLLDRVQAARRHGRWRGPHQLHHDLGIDA